MVLPDSPGKRWKTKVGTPARSKYCGANVLVVKYCDLGSLDTMTCHANLPRYTSNAHTANAIGSSSIVTTQKGICHLNLLDRNSSSEMPTFSHSASSKV